MPGVHRGSFVGYVWAGLWSACRRDKKGNWLDLGCPIYPGEASWAVCGLVCGVLGLGIKRKIGLG